MSLIAALAVALALLAMAAVYRWALRSWDIKMRALAVAAPFSQSLLLFFYAGLTFQDPFFTDALGVAVLLGAICLIADGVALPLFRRAQSKELEEQRAQVAAEYARAQECRARALEEEAREAAWVRERMAGQLCEASALLRSGASEAGVGCLEALGAPIAVKRSCAHEAADALLALKDEAAARAGISFQVSAHIPDDLPISDADLCAVLSNMIDNALAAAAGVQGKRRFVRLRAHVAQGHLVIAVENGFAPPQEPTFRKRGRRRRGLADHGWGLTILNDVAARHGGTFATEADGDLWRASCTLRVRGSEPEFELMARGR